VLGARRRIGGRWHGGDRRIGVVAVRLRSPAVRGGVHRRPDDCAHRRVGAVGADDTQANLWRVAPGAIAPRHWIIEPDLSNAVPFLAAAVVSGGSVRLTDWPRGSTQPADAILSI